EPEARRALLRGLRTAAAPAAAEEPDDHLLALVDLAAEHLGGGSVAEPESQRDRRRLAIRPDHPHAPLDAGPALAARRGGHLVVARLLGVGEDLADLDARRLTDFLGARATVGLGESLEGPQLLAAVLQDRLELRLLILSELQLFHQAIAYLLDRGLHTTRRATARRAAARLAAARRRVGRCRLDARRPEPERGVRNLQDARLLRGHELDVRRHSRNEPSRLIHLREDHR